MIDPPVNVASTNDAKNLAANRLPIAYGDKSVELKIMKDAISMYRDNFLEREKILEEEKRKLEELNYQVWSLEDSLCERVWQFSHQHQFSPIFQHHPFVTDCAKRRLNCKDVERNFELINLTNEIDAIKAEIDLNQGGNVKQEVENALTKLGKLQLISNDIMELFRLIRPSEFCKLETISMPIDDGVMPDNKYKVKRRKIDPSYAKQTKTDKLDFTTNNKKLIFSTPKDYPQLSLERSIVFTANTLTSNEKLKNFRVKKRSEISIRFQEYRGHK